MAITDPADAQPPSPAKPRRRYTLADLRAARAAGRKVPMLTCYDYTTARLMDEVGVPLLLVGDSAANVILGHETTLPIRLRFLVDLAAAVRRGAPGALVVLDLPFGSYHASVAQAVRNVCRAVQLSGADCVKLEAAGTHLRTIRRCADAGVAVMAHLGLRPQAVGVLGGYRYQGRTAAEARDILSLATDMERHGAAALLLEAVPAEVSEAVVQAVGIPVIGCGAGPACHGHVVVTQDVAGLTPRPPRFAPPMGDVATPMRACFAEYVRRVEHGEYPAPEHGYPMPDDERQQFERTRRRFAGFARPAEEPSAL